MTPGARILKTAAGLAFLLFAWLIFSAAYDQFMYYHSF